MHFVYDIETLDTESSAVILSAAITYIGDDLENRTDHLDDLYDELVERSLYVKFKAKEQIDAGRSVSKSTLEWWKSQNDEVRGWAFNPTRQDVSAAEGLSAITQYILQYAKRQDNIIIWVRGALDQLCTESLCTTFNTPRITHYSNYRDVRTAIDIMAETARKGYCDLSRPFNKSKVRKHHPVHDCVYDGLMLTFPK